MASYSIKEYVVGEAVLSGGEVFYPVVYICGWLWRKDKWWELPPIPMPFNRQTVEYFKCRDDAEAYVARKNQEDK